jgi:prepilin-type N-terminal cleavage/methylation domain-containing protein
VPRSRRARGAGFTLLEVLAAVAVFAVFATLLAEQAMQGMRYEGDARRRMRASLLADRALWQVEAGLKLGAPPQPKQEVTETEDEFRVQLDIQPLDLAQLGLAPPAEAAGEARAPAAAAGALPLPLYHVSVRVAWLDGIVEQAVTRTTFAFDGTAVAQALGSAEAEQQQEQPEAAPPGEEEPQ